MTNCTRCSAPLKTPAQCDYCGVKYHAALPDPNQKRLRQSITVQGGSNVVVSDCRNSTVVINGKRYQL